MLGPSKSYLTLVDEQYQPPLLINDSPLRPSAAGECEHSLFLKYQAWKQKTPVSRVLTAREQRIFDLGFAVEDLIVEQFSKVPGFKVLFAQQIIDHGLIPGSTQLFQGSMDWCWVSEEHKVVMDAKSRKDRSWGNSSSWDKDIAEATQFGTSIDSNGVFISNVEEFVDKSKDDTLIKNIKQLNIYATSSFCQVRGIDHASIIRYNKNDSRQFEFRFHPSQLLLEHVKEKFGRVASASAPYTFVDVCRPGSISQQYCDGCCGKQYQTVGRSQGETKSKQMALEEVPTSFKELAVRELQLLTKHQSKKLVDWMLDQEITKITIDTNTALVVKLLQSPKPHYELRVEPILQRKTK